VIIVILGEFPNTSTRIGKPEQIRETPSAVAMESFTVYTEWISVEECFKQSWKLNGVKNNPLINDFISSHFNTVEGNL
jgi:hypothetical protein